VFPTVLIVEDNSVIREFIRLNLETNGWKVREAENVSLALGLFRQLQPQLVTLDLIMPFYDGLDAMQFARLIKEEAPEVALLVVSAVGSKLVHWWGSITSSEVTRAFLRKHDFEVFDKSPDDPTLKKLFSRTDALMRQLSGPRCNARVGPAVSDGARRC